MKYSRKINQFRNLSRKIDRLISNGTWYQLAPGTQVRMLGRLRHLFSIIRNVMAAGQLKKVMAGAALLLCFSTAGAQSFLPGVVNPYGITTDTSFSSPAFADIDNDGDYDLFLMDFQYSTYSISMKFYQNTGSATNPVFGAPVLNPNGLTISPMTYRGEFVDLDHDGDLDLLTGEYYGTMGYYENTGTAGAPSFIAGVQNPFGLDSVSEIALPTLADLDDDGDLDLLVAEYYGNLNYFQNIGTSFSPVFGPPTVNPSGLSVVDDFATPVFADLDNDGDADLLVVSYYNDFYYFENTGTAAAPAFAAPQLNPFGLSDTLNMPMPAFVDIDGDGDLDLFMGSYGGSVVFYENTAANSVAENDALLAPQVFPNPAGDQVTIRLSGNGEDLHIFLKDGMGRTIREMRVSGKEITLPTDDLAPGAYVLQMIRKDRTDEQKLILQ